MADLSEILRRLDVEMPAPGALGRVSSGAGVPEAMTFAELMAILFPAAPVNVAGSRADTDAALLNLLTALETLGLITDSSET